MRSASLLIALMTATATPLPAFARIQPEIVCIDSEMEFPVACDEDDDDCGGLDICRGASCAANGSKLTGTRRHGPS